MRLSYLLLPLLLCAIAPPCAGTPGTRRDQIVSSLSVSGTIEIDPSGKVVDYAIKDAQAYDQPILDLLAQRIPRWAFKPVVLDGTPRQARFAMYLRLEAKRIDPEHYAIAIASSAFGQKEAAAAHSEVTARGRLSPPGYPLDEMRNRIGATVVVVLRVGPSGEVMDAVVEQTNLKAVGRDRDMAQWRKDFEREALSAARRWTFDPPTSGAAAALASWDVRTPVVFIPYGAKRPGPGQWESFVPGPRHEVPWRPKTQLADSGGDALPAGGVFPLEQPLQLLTPLNAS